MKRLILLLGLITSFNSSYAENVAWQDLNKSCFVNYAIVQQPVSGTIKIAINPHNNIFFVQSETALPFRVFEFSAEQFIDYQVLDLFGEDLEQQKYLKDENQITTVTPKNFYKKFLQIEAKQILKANSFHFRLSYDGALKPRYWVSLDNQNYTEVARVDNVDWKFLKIEFENHLSTDQKFYPLIIKNINITEKGKATYVVNTVADKPLELYAEYECDPSLPIKLANETAKKAEITKFSLDLYTKKYDLDFYSSPFYNKDFDGDGIENANDNCPLQANINQVDTDGDLVGNVCDYNNQQKGLRESDADRDGIGDSLDNCQFVYNPNQLDINADGIGDVCADDDLDGIIGERDNCKDTSNRDQKDVNNNGVGDACEFDKDQDTIFDSIDNCITTPNPDQADQDKDGIGDSCDNCERFNPQQIDKNQNGIGDICDQAAENLEISDADKDRIHDARDNCPKISNPEQEDKDHDGTGDACDNCLNVRNPKQEDENKNNVGDLCEDSDGDGVVGYLDNCIAYANHDQKDTDNDGIGDVCEDDDHDKIVAINDNCPFDYNPYQWDNDDDKIGDECDKKDDRYIESNKNFIVAGIVAVTLIFVAFILVTLRKLKVDK